MEKTHTIAAISTPPGTGGISCIRISGEKAFEITSKIFKCHKKFEKIKSHTVTYGKIVDKNKKTVDEVLVLKMKKPKTYTKENLVEIQCHGNYIVTTKILNIVYKNGAKPAEPGEFTKRAFLNGRIDLLQAEAVMDLINSKTEKSEKSALRQLEGKIGDKIKKIRQEIVNVLSHISVSIDYPEYEDDAISVEKALKRILDIKNKTIKLIENYDTGKILREGLNVAVIGPANAGKSTFINKVIGEDRAIVTHIPGTTRDVLEVEFSLKGYPVIFYDTAGIRKTDDFIEKIGIEKSIKTQKKSNLTILILDASKPITEEEKDLIANADLNNTIFIINKVDLNSGKEFEKYIKSKKIVKASLLNEEGIDEILEKVYDEIKKGKSEEFSITNARHKMHIDNALLALDKSIETAQNSTFLDLMAIDLIEAIEELGKITGENTGEDVIKNIFNNFCVGK